MTPPPVSRGPVFWGSLSILAYEVFLARIFAVSQWNHLLFMVISIALFGLAGGGVLLSVLGAHRPDWHDIVCGRRGQLVLCALLSLCVMGSYLGLNALPLDYFRLPLEPVQMVYLLIAYLLLAAPFFVGGVIVSGSYSAHPHQSGAIYFAAMAGSACGAVMPALLIPWLSESLWAASAGLPPLAAMAIHAGASGIPGDPGTEKRRPPAVALLLGVAAVGLALFMLSPRGAALGRIRSSEYKGLSQALRLPDTRVVESRRSLRGNIDRVDGPHLRFAPGLSLNYTEALPAQQVAFTDRDTPLTLYPKQASELGFARATLSSAVYHMVPEPGAVLLITENGGLGIACALANAASGVRAVIANPQMAEIVGRHYGLTVVADHPRTYLARSAEAFDIIHLEGWGSTIPGAGALSQNHDLTVDAFETYLRHLKPSGAIAISRKLLLPPSDSLRLWATAYAALTRLGVSEPSRHIAVLRNWDTFTLLISLRPIEDPTGLRAFARRFRFDMVYLHGLTGEMANRFNVLPQPYYFAETSRLADAFHSGRQAEFFASYPLDVAPQGDQRPFPGCMLKWSRVLDLYKSVGSRLTTVFLSGEVVVMAVFLEALLVSALLLLLPAAIDRRRRRAPSTPSTLYFFGIGCGYMLVELYFIHLCSFLLGDPAVGFAVVAAGLLVFSGLGGLWSHSGKLSTARIAMLSVILVVAGAGAVQHFGLGRLLALPRAARYALAVLLLLPPGLMMGVPFAIGMRRLAPGPAGRTYAWAVNGCASVIAVVMAAQLAISRGLTFLLIAAAASYSLGLAGTYVRRPDAADG